MIPAYEQWATALSPRIAGALDEFREDVHDKIVLFAVDCHPWHGSLDLALLTQSEVNDDPLLSDPTEMVAWKYFHFTADLPSWQGAAELAAQMRAAYEAAEDRAAIADGYLMACAKALGSDKVQTALGKYDLVEGFTVSVRHPDTEREYYPLK